MPYQLPHVKGQTLIHQHGPTEACIITPQPDMPLACRYEPSLWTRIKMWF